MTEGGEWLEQRQKDLGTDNKPFRRKMSAGGQNKQWETTREMLSGFEKSISTMWCKKTDNKSRRAGGQAQRDTQSIVIMVMSSSLHSFIPPPIISISLKTGTPALCMQEESHLPSSDPPPMWARICHAREFGPPRWLSRWVVSPEQQPEGLSRTADWLDGHAGLANEVAAIILWSYWLLIRKKGGGRERERGREKGKPGKELHDGRLPYYSKQEADIKKNTFCSLPSAPTLFFLGFCLSVWTDYLCGTQKNTDAATCCD